MAVTIILGPMLWDLHGLILEGIWDDTHIGERWLASFASRPVAPSGTLPNLVFRLSLVKEAPPAPPTPPDFKQDDLLAYYLHENQALAHFPRYGQMRLNLTQGTTTGDLTTAVLTTYGVFEDLLAIGLSPHLRRRGLFLIHAFAAVHSSETVLIVGDIGAGKTTTGLALLRAGWKLLSNDSPVLREGQSGGSPEVLAYPSLLSAYLDSLLRFPELHRLITTNDLPPGGERRKIMFSAEEFFPNVWAERAPLGAILFPQIEDGASHTLEELSPPEALQMLLPHAVEQWDREMIPAHLALLNQAVQAAPAYRLRLGVDVHAIPATVASALSQ